MQKAKVQVKNQKYEIHPRLRAYSAEAAASTAQAGRDFGGQANLPFPKGRGVFSTFDKGGLRVRRSFLVRRLVHQSIDVGGSFNEGGSERERGIFCTFAF